MCVCVCVRERERERHDRNAATTEKKKNAENFSSHLRNKIFETNESCFFSFCPEEFFSIKIFIGGDFDFFVSVVETNFSAVTNFV